MIINNWYRGSMVVIYWLVCCFGCWLVLFKDNVGVVVKVFLDWLFFLMYLLSNWFIGRCEEFVCSFLINCGVLVLEVGWVLCLLVMVVFVNK